MIKKSLITFLALIIAYVTNAQRNVLLIIADDLGTDYCGFYEDHADTANIPHIRSLLSKGIRFQNAMANPVCSPTRAGMFTGRYSFRTGVGNVVSAPNQLDTAEITIPRLLNSYDPNIAKAQIGKWHLHIPNPASHLFYPNIMGYDYYAGNFSGALADFYNWTKITNGVSGNSTTYATTETANDAITWIKGQNAKPFFLWLAFNAPHSPFHLPPFGMYADTTLTGTTVDINMHPKKYFKAMLEALDHEIGRVLDSLQTFNKLDSTDIIFIGDNGNAIQTAQITNVNRAKGTIYQYGVHVPFIIAGPSVVNPNRVSDALINTHDLFATILELMGDTTWQLQIPFNKPVDSKSILPIIKNQSTQIRPWSFTEIFKVAPDSGDGKAMRNQEYKLLNFDFGQQEFYNLAIDSLEANNLLTGTLTATDMTNYNYLCNEMTTLVGAGNFCSAVGINEIKNSAKNLLTYPNPFNNFIYLKLKSGREKYQLSDGFGQLIYSGTKIELQDFSFLAKGIYFLKIIDLTTTTLKLVKQ